MLVCTYEGMATIAQDLSQVDHIITTDAWTKAVKLKTPAVH